ncbi:hypothetical protein ILUMI_22920 [Ignelater luminosus]|uniref:Uncharacterized protein n=1 Tax=Ignelater luminosus TaxID=2038154 RepID=A0A8K0C945_IGNLU|nr:hypothetical protein ILUMI_22920 [Ignelater luminosus]
MSENIKEVNEILKESAISGYLNKERLLAVVSREIDNHRERSPERWLANRNAFRQFQEQLEMAEPNHQVIDFESDSGVSESSETISYRESISDLSDEFEWVSDEETPNGDLGDSNPSPEEQRQENNSEDDATESKQNDKEEGGFSGEKKVLSDEEPSTSSGCVAKIGWNKRKMCNLDEEISARARFGFKKQKIFVPFDDSDDSSLD